MRTLGRFHLTSPAEWICCPQPGMWLQQQIVQQCCAVGKCLHASNLACRQFLRLGGLTLCMSAFHRCASSCCMSACIHVRVNLMQLHFCCLLVLLPGFATRCAQHAGARHVYQHCQQAPAAAPVCALVETLNFEGLFTSFEMAQSYPMLSASPYLGGAGEDNQTKVAVQAQRNDVLLEPGIADRQGFWPTIRKVHMGSLPLELKWPIWGSEQVITETCAKLFVRQRFAQHRARLPRSAGAAVRHHRCTACGLIKFAQIRMHRARNSMTRVTNTNTSLPRCMHRNCIRVFAPKVADATEGSRRHPASGCTASALFETIRL